MIFIRNRCNKHKITVKKKKKNGKWKIQKKVLENGNNVVPVKAMKEGKYFWRVDCVDDGDFRRGQKWWLKAEP